MATASARKHTDTLQIPHSACHRCGQLHAPIQLQHRQKASCTRCGARLAQYRADANHKLLALQITNLILLLIANSLPFLTLSAGGQQQTALLMSGAWALAKDGLPLMGLLMAFTGLIAPLLVSSGLIWVMWQLKRPSQQHSAQKQALTRHILKISLRLAPWNLSAVLMLGVLVSISKLIELAQVIPGTGLYAFIALIFSAAWSWRYLDSAHLWQQLKSDQPEPSPTQALQQCHHCRQLLPIEQHRCPHCHSKTHPRSAQTDRNARQRAWALLITAALLLIPANLYPVMVYTQLGQASAKTLIGGVIALIEAHMWPLALIVLFASIAVPLAKLGSLAYLLISVQNGHSKRRADRTRLYRLTETIGAWSMVDVYVIAILAALVQLGPLAQVQAQIGILYFGLAVLATLFATHQFDPRMLWGKDEINNPADKPRDNIS